MWLCPAPATPTDPPALTAPALRLFSPTRMGRTGGCATRPKAGPWHTDTMPIRSIVFLSRGGAGILIELGRGCGITASRRHPDYLQNPNSAVERHRNHIPTLHVTTGRR